MQKVSGGMMTERKCSYCEAVADSHKSLADQGWTAVVCNVRMKGVPSRFHKRACPAHKERMTADLTAFLDKYDKEKGW